MITIRNMEEMEKYYVERFNTYVFDDNVLFLVDIDVKPNIVAHNITANNINAFDIRAWNIYAQDINAWNIETCDINAWDIRARNIRARHIKYNAVCYSNNNIECKSIHGRHRNSKHFVLDGELIVKG